jgi:hypothetical protein
MRCWYVYIDYYEMTKDYQNIHTSGWVPVFAKSEDDAIKLAKLLYPNVDVLYASEEVPSDA